MRKLFAAKQAIKQSDKKVAYIITDIGSSTYIFTAHIGWDKQVKYNLMGFKNGDFAQSGGVFDFDKRIPKVGWLPLTAHNTLSVLPQEKC